MDNQPHVETPTVFMAEDDPLLGQLMQLMLEGNGFSVQGPHASVVSGLDALKLSRPDVAMLDYELRDGNSCALARALEARSIPFIIVTGNLPDVLPAVMRRHRVLVKPVDEGDLIEELDACRANA